MKLKQLPDDFFVEEATDVSPAEKGPFALYRLEKRGWSTPDALSALRRRWRIEARRVSYGGLKDRHAWTIQYLTIFHGPARGLHHHDVTVTHLGWTDAPYTSHDIRCNRFRLTLRDLSPEAVGARGPPWTASPWRACRIISTTSASAQWPARDRSSSPGCWCAAGSRTRCGWR